MTFDFKTKGELELWLDDIEVPIIDKIARIMDYLANPSIIYKHYYVVKRLKNLLY